MNFRNSLCLFFLFSIFNGFVFVSCSNENQDTKDLVGGSSSQQIHIQGGIRNHAEENQESSSPPESEIEWYTDVHPLSSTLHLLPPLAPNPGDRSTFDLTLESFLRVVICEVISENECQEVLVFTAESGKGMKNSLMQQEDHYHLNWKINKELIGKMVEIRFLVADLEIGFLEVTPLVPRALPIKFGIDNHPRIRARVLTEMEYKAHEITLALRDEFDLDPQQIARLLYVENFEATEVALALLEVFGPEIDEIATILRQVGYTPSEVAVALRDGFDMDSLEAAQVMKNVGFTAPQVYDILKNVFGETRERAREILFLIGYTEDEIFEAVVTDLVPEFAPQLRFDGSAYNYPMSAQLYYDTVIATGRWNDPDWTEIDFPFWYGAPQMDNRDVMTVTNNTAPTYYKAFRCGSQVRIIYWWFYGYQAECIDLGIVRFGHHNGDWEKVMVTLSEDTTRAAAITYWQHSGRYTRLAGDNDWHACPPWDQGRYDCGFTLYQGKHPIVYAGKNQHGSYYNQGGLGGCGYQYDFRNNNGYVNKRLDTWQTLINLSAMEEPWMTADAAGGFTWGYDGVSTHPTTDDAASCNMDACVGVHRWAPLETSGCYESQCRASDRWAWPSCYHCPRGTTDWGLICVDNCSTYPLCPSSGISTYGIDYTIPTGDAGLLYSQ